MNKNKKEGDRYKIYCRVIVSRKKAEFYTGFLAYENHWDEAAQRLKPDMFINQELVETEREIYQIRRSLIDEKTPINARRIVDLYRGDGKREVFLLEYLESYLNYIRAKGEIRKPTIEHYKGTYNILRNYVHRYLRTKDFLIGEVNYKFIEDFDLYLSQDYRDKKGNIITRNTVNKHHSRLRTILHNSLKQEIINRNPYQNFVLRNTKTKRVYLTWEELEKIRNHDLVGNWSLKKVRDFFLFSCYTGLRFTDALNLTMDNIIKDEKGVLLVEITMGKTNDVVLIPLIEEAVGIINKYKEDPGREVYRYVLPRCSNQKANTYLKAIAGIVGIEKDLTHHVARHTFATLALNRNIPIEVVQKLLGHTDIRTTQLYAKMMTPTIIKEMEKFGKIK